MNEPFTSSTLQDFISLGEDDEFTHYNFSILELIDNNIEVPLKNILENDYLDELRTLAENVTLSDEEFRQYRYKPQLLSIALYDTPELYFVILAINDMISKKDFCEKTIKLISTDNMLQIINYIYNAEEEYIEDNRISIDEKKEEV